MRTFTVTIGAALAVAGCGSSGGSSPANQQDNEVHIGTPIVPDAPSAPSSYNFRKVDLYRSPAADICRSRDASFLETIASRARAALPPSSYASFAFEDFTVTDGYEGKKREAILRFRADPKGRGTVLMYAVGDFDAATCGVRNMRVGVGAYPSRETRSTEVKAPESR